MPKYQVRIDACFIYDLEGDNPEQAQGIAEDLFEFDAPDGRITETLVFEEDECESCAQSIETRCSPCDECGHIDENDDA